MKRIKYIFIFLFILIIFFLFTVIFSIIIIGNNNIISGISINHVNISHKSKEDSKSLLSELINKKNKQEIKLEYTGTDNNYEKLLDLSILNLNYDIDEGTNDAFKIGRSENIFKNNLNILKTLITNKNITLKYTYDEDILNAIISDISSNLPNKYIQNSYYIEDGNLIITRGSSGTIVDSESLKKAINENISDFSSNLEVIEIPTKYIEPDEIDIDKIHLEIYKEAQDAYYEKNPFKVHTEIKGVDFDIEKAKSFIKANPDSKEYSIPLKYTIPKITIKNLNINIFPDKLSTFSTRYDVTNTDRSTNLEIAASKINNIVLSPGEEFSYNKIVGERSISAGYKEAKVYQNGQIVDGLGGGICQVSSTLYNAVVFANLKVIERFNHQFTTSYVKPGRDATVAYGVKDFKFKNTRTYPIKLKVSIDSGIAKVDIYGIKEKIEYEIDFDTEIISNIPYETKKEIDSSLPEGTETIKQRGADGIIVNVYKIKKQNGITLSREFISKDKYNALDKVIVKSSN